jgi:hypothetical protein
VAEGQPEVMEESYVPPRNWRRTPEWVEQLEAIDPNLKALLDEVYEAANDRQPRLLSMGVRAALDQVMVAIVGDVGTFEQKLAKMVADGHLSARQRNMLETVIDAGSSATHRGFRPPRSLLLEMMVVMEGVIRDHFITSETLQQLKRLIPPKPPRRPLRPNSEETT